MKRLSACVVAAAMVLGLVACNAGEDFADAVVTGPIRDQRPKPAPLPKPDEPAVEVELVVGFDRSGIRPANIANLGFKCTESVGTIRATGERPFIARCATSADRIEFFVGGTDTDSRRITLGTAFLPLCTGRSVGSTGSACGGGTGYFQVTLADIIPARDTDLGLISSSPARRESADNEVRNLAAFLAALDNGSSTRAIVIRDDAINQAGTAPPTSFAGTWPEFEAYWSGWLTTIGATLPSAASAQQMVQVAADRTRTGLYYLEHDSFFYTGAFQRPATNIKVILPFMVLPGRPNGAVAEVRAVGAVLAAAGTDSNIESAVDVLALNRSARLDEEQIFTSASSGPWESQSVIDPVVASLNFNGRILGAGAYDNLTSTLDRNDYLLDYPATGVYSIREADVARFSGTVNAGGAAPVPYVDEPFRVARTGYVAATMDAALLGQAAGFYRLTLYKACVENAAACQPIPEKEIGPGLNYPDYIDNDDCDDDDPDPAKRPVGGLCNGTPDDVAVDVVNERPRGGAGYAFAEGSFTVQILSNGDIVTDRDGQCRSLNSTTLERDNGAGSTRQEDRVGFVTRTTPAGEVITSDSVNVLVYMAGGREQATGLEALPHFGTQIQGRINLSLPGMPMFRLGDDNYVEGVRAFWQDFYQAALFANPLTDFSGTNGHRIKALQTGAVQAVRLDGVAGNCQPVL